MYICCITYKLTNNIISAYHLYYLAVFVSWLFVGESFSSAIRGNNSPGPDKLRDNLFDPSLLVLVLLLLTSATETEASSLSTSLTVSVDAVDRQTVLELPLLAALTTGELPDEAQHNGEIKAHLLSALRGCKRSGDKALRNNGDPGSEPFGRAKPFFVCPDTDAVGVLPALGEYDCVVFELPG